MTNVKAIVDWISKQYGFPPPSFRLMCRDRCNDECSSLACYNPKSHQINFMAFDPPVELVAHEMGHIAYRFKNKCLPFGENFPNPIDNEKFAQKVESWASANMPNLSLDIDWGISILEGIGNVISKLTSDED